jgi:hypothetical protein
MRDIDDASGHERTAVIDPNCHGLPSRDVRHPQPRTERQRWMSGGHFVRIKPFAARGLCSFGVEAGKSMRRNLRLGRIFVRRERGMLPCVRYTPLRHEGCLSIVFQRRLAAGTQFGFLGDDRGLSAGCKTSRSPDDGKPPNGVPNCNGQRRVRTNTACLDVNVRSSGTADGRHIAPQPTEIRQAARAEPNNGGTMTR